ncbi:MAG: hypothetical protein AB7I18_09755 [Candidatus Berkiella sp.]
MLSTNRSRFITEQAVIKTLTNATELPAKMKPRLCATLQLPEDSIIDNLSVVLTKGVGGTQCRPYVVTLQGGEKVFLKLSNIVKNSLREQKIADTNIQNVLGADAHPFVCMFPSSGALGVEKETRNELLFFPYVPGDNLFITLQYRNNEKQTAILQFTEIGQCLAKMHIECMKLLNTYDQFTNNKGLLTKVLVHDDWQATNIMITPENKAIIIDTEGTMLSDKPYRNIAESWELSSQDPELFNALIDGYINEYSPDLREGVRHNLMKVLSDEYHIELSQLKNTITPTR